MWEKSATGSQGGVRTMNGRRMIERCIWLMRVAVRPRLGGQELGAEGAGRAGAVLHHDRLAELAAGEFGERAELRVGRAAGRPGDDQADRAVRELALGEAPARRGRPRRRAQRQRRRGGRRRHRGMRAHGVVSSLCCRHCGGAAPPAERGRWFRPARLPRAPPGPSFGAATTLPSAADRFGSAMPESFDLIVIGAGPGGYVCAIRAAQLGMKVGCVEKRATLGGTCLNIGCIPSKALLQSSEHYEEARHKLADHGVLVNGDVGLDLGADAGAQGRGGLGQREGRRVPVPQEQGGLAQGRGAHQPRPNTVAVGGEEYETKNIVIASGSESIPLPGVEVDEKSVVTSTGGLELDRVPGHLVVIGGGYIGLELGSVWRRLGAEVTVVEFLDRIVPGMDGEVGKTFERVLTKQGFKFRLKTKVTAARKGNEGVVLTVEPAEGGPAEEIAADVVLVAIGRRADGGGAGPRRRRRGAGRARAGEGGRALRHQRAGHLRHRRRHRRADAGAQGGGGGRGGGRAHRRPGGPRELRGDPGRGLHLAGGRLRRARRRSSSRPTACSSRPASSPSPPTAARARWATRTAS